MSKSESSRWWEQPPQPGLTRVGSLQQKVLASFDGEGRLHGPMTCFDDREGAKPSSECHWDHGVLHGPHTIWTGQHWRTASFDRGTPHGRWMMGFGDAELGFMEFDHGVPTTGQVGKWLTKSFSAPQSYVLDGMTYPTLDEGLAATPAPTRLEIYGNPNAELPAAVWDLPSLEMLKIEACGLEAIPAGIGKLTNLKQLLVGKTQVKSVAADIGTLQHLQIVWLTNSLLIGCPAFANPELVEIDLSRNLMLRIGTSFAKCPKLRTLRLNGNHLMLLDENVFSAPSLEALECTGCCWLTWLSPALGQARALKTLNLNNQWILDLPDTIADCASLTHLMMNGAKLARRPAGLENRIVRKVNLIGSPFYYWPGNEDYDEQLDLAWDQVRTPEQQEHAKLMRERRVQARAEAARLQAQAREDQRLRGLGSSLTAASAGLAPPSALPPVPTMDERWFDAKQDRSGSAIVEDLVRIAADLKSADFGCEHGSYAVDVFAGTPGVIDDSLTEVLLWTGLLQPTSTTDVAKRALRNQRKQPLLKALEALAPTEGWVLDVLPKKKKELELSFWVQQLAPSVWAAIGPKVLKNDAFQANTDFPEFAPGEGGMRDLLMMTCLLSNASELCYQGLRKEDGERVQVVLESTRERAIAKLLAHAGVATQQPFVPTRLADKGDGVQAVGALLAELEDTREILVGAVSLFHRIWVGRSADGVPIGIRTRVIWS